MRLTLRLLSTPSVHPARSWQLIEERRVALETYLRHILSHKNSAYRSSHAFLDFLAAPPLQPGSGGGGGGPPSASSSAANPPSTTAQHPTLPPAPTSFAGSPAWLSEYQTLQALTRTIRASLGRRDELLRGGQTSGGHTAGVVARKDLGLLLARLGVLAGELPGLGQKEKLGTGEMGRRSEMVTALQDDCVRLTKQAAVTPRSARSDAAAAGGGGWDEPDDGARNALLGGARKAKPQGGETDQTRALDDGALMHLQQTQVEDQDAMLRQLSVRPSSSYTRWLPNSHCAPSLTLLAAAVCSPQTILQRQKTLGEAISTEINEQNELLDHLSQDVDRTGGKLGRTKRQMNRLN